MKTIFKNCNLIDGINELKKNVSVVVEDGKITDILEDSSSVKGQVIDCTDKYLMPGMINLHLHLFGSGVPSKVLGGGPLQKVVLKVAKSNFGVKILTKMLRKNAKDILYSGVTTARSCGDFMYTDVMLRDDINADKTVGPNLLVSGPAITVPTGHGDGTFAITSDTPEGIAKLVDEVASKGVDLIKICITGGVMDAKKEGEPGELKMTVPFAKAACDEAHKLGLIVASHTESPEGVITAIESGVDTVEHGSLIDEEHIEKIKEYGGAFICTMSPALPLAKLSPELTKLNPMCVFNSNVVFENMVKGSKAMIASGAKVGLGTDATCPFVTQYNTYMEVKYAHKYLGLSNLEAINYITMKNAEIIHKDNEIGSIEIGKNADMVMFNKNPLDDLDNLSTPVMVVKGGRIYDDIAINKNENIEKELAEMFKAL